jgi:hypothetical protein
MVKTLMDSVRGRYRLITVSKTEYLIDLDQMTLTRYPLEFGAERDLASGLRRDRSAVSLLRVLGCTVGRSAHFVVNLDVGRGVITLRSTTEVVSISAETRSDEYG